MNARFQSLLPAVFPFVGRSVDGKVAPSAMRQIDLAGPLAHEVGQHTVDAGGRETQGDQPEVLHQDRPETRRRRILRQRPLHRAEAHRSDARASALTQITLYYKVMTRDRPLSRHRRFSEVSP